MRKRFFMLSVCLLLILAIAPLAMAQKKVTLRWTNTPEAIGDVDNGAFMKAIKAKFPDVEIQWEPILYSAIPTKFPTLMASGDMPDMFQLNTQSYLPQLVDGKLIAPLDSVLAKYGKDIVGNSREGQLAFGQYSGKQYAIPNSYSLKYFAMNIRMDWLDNLHLKVPVTLEDFHQVARAFTFNDPDGNGKNDTYGIAWRQNVNFIDAMFAAFGVTPGHHQAGNWRVRNGKQTFDWVQPGMKQALVYLAGWYKEGIVHPDSLTFDWNGWWAAYLQNKVGMWYHQPRRLSEMNSALKQAGIVNAKMWPIDPPKGPAGQGTTNEGQPWGEAFSPRNLEKAVEVFNFTFTQDFFLACGGQEDYAFAPKLALGPNGWPMYYTYDEALNDPGYEKRRTDVLYSQGQTGWALENPNMTKTWPNKELGKYVYQQFLNTNGPAQIVGNALADKWAITTTKKVPVPADAKYFVNLQTAFREMSSKIVSGGNADQAWNDWISFYNANGGPEIEKEVNALMPVK
jgi:putative aldouronate transport system substrate-binding protein